MRQVYLMLCLVAVLGFSASVNATLTGEWIMDEGTGTTVGDSSGFGNDGTLSGSYSWVVDGGDTGAGDDALTFGGTDGRLDIPNADWEGEYYSIQANTQFIVIWELKIKVESTYTPSGVKGEGIIAWTDTASGDFNGDGSVIDPTHVRGAKELLINSSGQLFTQVYGIGAGSGTGTTDIRNGQWRDIKVVWTMDTTDGVADRVTVYLDGNVEIDLTGVNLTAHDADVETVRDDNIDNWNAPGMVIGSLENTRSDRPDYFNSFGGDIDDVKITMGFINAGNPVPGNGDDVDSTTLTTLSWDAPTAYTPAADYYVEFRKAVEATEPNWAAATGTSTGTSSAESILLSSLSPAVTLAPETTYYWRVTSYEPNTVPIPHVGPDWSFATLSLAPSIGDPVISFADGTTPGTLKAVLTVTGENVETYEWYQGTTLVGTTTVPTFEIDPVAVANEGLYHCEGVKTGFDPAVSSDALLITPRLMAYWNFENDLDAVDDDGATSYTGSYVLPDGNSIGDLSSYYIDTTGDSSAPSNTALKFLNDPNHVRVANSEDWFNFYPQGFTVASWVKPDAVSGGLNMVSKMDNDNNIGGFQHQLKDTKARLVMRADGNIDSVSSTTTLAASEWVYVTMSYEPNEVTPGQGTLKVYVDGLLENTASSTDAPYTASPVPLVFGATGTEGVSPLAGLLDEVKIWSYALTDTDVAQEYVNVTQNPLCVEFPQYDLNEDCIVDLADFAMLAAHWLDSNLVSPE